MRVSRTVRRISIRQIASTPLSKPVKIIEEGMIPEVETERFYDNAGRVEYVTKEGQTTDFQYVDASRIVKMVYPSGSYAQYTYDERDRAKVIEHKTAGHVLIDKEDNTYGPTSNVDTRVSGGVTTTFGYDNIVGWA
ncbi:MAG: hypothetical protein ACR2HJ_04535 [Fimbriimonadales bacterium]